MRSDLGVCILGSGVPLAFARRLSVQARLPRQRPDAREYRGKGSTLDVFVEGIPKGT